MPKLDFSFAVPAEANDVAALIERAYRGPQAADTWTTEAGILVGPRSSIAEVSALLADPNGRFVTHRDGSGVLQGCAFVQKHSVDAAYFSMFAIDPAAQNSGLGKALIARCEAAVVELWGVNSMRLTVISIRDTLIAWYERRGYRRTGERLPFPFRADSGALRTDFDLVVLEKPLASGD